MQGAVESNSTSRGAEHGTALEGVNLESGATLGQLLIAATVMLVSSGIAWGNLLTRVRTLEKQIDGLPHRLTRVETVVEGIQSDVTEIKGDVKDALTELRSFRPEAPTRPRRP